MERSESSAAQGRSMWKSSFTLYEWLAGIVLGAFMGASIMLIVWLVVGEPRV